MQAPIPHTQKAVSHFPKRDGRSQNAKPTTTRLEVAGGPVARLPHAMDLSVDEHFRARAYADFGVWMITTTIRVGGNLIGIDLPTIPANLTERPGRPMSVTIGEPRTSKGSPRRTDPMTEHQRG